MAKLILITPNGGTRLIPLAAPETTLGRGNENHVVLDSPIASRAHAALRADGPFVTIRDLGSRNGTYVNGRRVESQVLANGDTIDIGDTRLRFLSSDQEPVSAEALRLLTTRGMLN